MVFNKLAKKYAAAFQDQKVFVESFWLAAKVQRWRCLNAISAQGEQSNFHTELLHKESQTV